MKELVTVIIDAVQKQGLSLLLILAAAIYFYERTTVLEAKIDQCESKQIELLTNTVATNTEQLKENNGLLNDIRFRLQAEPHTAVPPPNATTGH